MLSNTQLSFAFAGVGGRKGEPCWCQSCRMLCDLHSRGCWEVLASAALDHDRGGKQESRGLEGYIATVWCREGLSQAVGASNNDAKDKRFCFPPTTATHIYIILCPGGTRRMAQTYALCSTCSTGCWCISNTEKEIRWISPGGRRKRVELVNL